MKAKEQLPVDPTKATTEDQAATGPHAPQQANYDNSTVRDPDHERSGGMSGGLGKKDHDVPWPGDENRPQDRSTTPPSTPQGPASIDRLVSPEYRSGPYPGDKPDQPAGEGSAVATHSPGLSKEAREAAHEGSATGGPTLDPAGRDNRKKEGREKNEP